MSSLLGAFDFTLSAFFLVAGGGEGGGVNCFIIHTLVWKEAKIYFSVLGLIRLYIFRAWMILTYKILNVLCGMVLSF